MTSKFILTAAEKYATNVELNTIARSYDYLVIERELSLEALAFHQVIDFGGTVKVFRNDCEAWMVFTMNKEGKIVAVDARDYNGEKYITIS